MHFLPRQPLPDYAVKTLDEGAAARRLKSEKNIHKRHEDKKHMEEWTWNAEVKLESIQQATTNVAFIPGLRTNTLSA